MFGRRLRRIRRARDKSLRVLAGLSGVGRMTLQRIESGERAATLPEIVALADALHIAPSELTTLPVPAPANGHTDSTVEAVRLALDGIEVGESAGLVLPVEVLAGQVAQLHAQRRACRFAEVATALPALIRNLHTTLATGTDHAELLQLAVYLHVHVTRPWMLHAGAPTDLQRRVIFLARRMAQERDEVTTLAVAGYAVVGALLSGGASGAGKAALDSLTQPPTTASTAGLVCALTVCHAYAAVRDGRPGDVTAPMDAAAEVAGRFGATRDIDSLGFMHIPANTGIDRMWLALEADDPDQAVSIAQEMRPEYPSFPLVRAKYWTHYGRALAQLRGRHEDAVRALRTAEDIYPTKVRRDPQVREAIAVLLSRVRRDSPAGRELRRMAYRAGLVA